MNDKIKGILFICATPIGNLDDITFRVLKTLKEVDLIACEDTRHTQKLLNYFQITTKTTSYHEHNETVKGKYLIEKLLEGKNIALVSDAGMPAISDPGYTLVKLCIENDIDMTVLPGAVALTTALVLSGISARRFVFEGFLPRNKNERGIVLEELRKETRTIILYEAPHHLIKTLSALIDVLGPERFASTIKELTKKFENVKRGSLFELYNYYLQNEPKGEFVIIISGLDYNILQKEKILQWEKISIAQHVEIYTAKGFTEKDAIKKTANDRGVSKREIYAHVKKLDWID